jgi:hypothetical protein
LGIGAQRILIKEASVQVLRWAAVSALLLVPNGVTAQQALESSRPAVAVLPAVHSANGPGDCDVGTAHLLAAFRRQPSVDLIDPARVEQVLEELLLPGFPRVLDGQALHMGRQLNARYLVITDFAPADAGAVLEVQVLDARNGLRVGLPVRAQGSVAELPSIFDDVAAELIQRFEPAQRVAERRIPVEASIAYARGLDYEKRGRTDLAARLFQRALQLYPRHDHARSALDRIQRGGQR